VNHITDETVTGHLVSSVKTAEMIGRNSMGRLVILVITRDRGTIMQAAVSRGCAGIVINHGFISIVARNSLCRRIMRRYVDWSWFAVMGKRMTTQRIRLGESLVLTITLVMMDQMTSRVIYA